MNISMDAIAKLNILGFNVRALCGVVLFKKNLEDHLLAVYLSYIFPGLLFLVNVYNVHFERKTRLLI
jgi:hypothetical protein